LISGCAFFTRWRSKRKREEENAAMPHAGPAFQPADIGAALALLTRLPVPLDHRRAAARGARAAWAWPLAGAVVGALAGVLGEVCLALGLPSGIVAAAVLATLALLTGALHEDGLADTADGLWGGSSRAARLDIMRDSRLGSYGALALILAVLARWSGICALEGGLIAPLVAVGAVSRAPMAAALWGLGPARAAGLAAAQGRAPAAAALGAAGLALGLAVLATGAAGLVLAVAAALGALAVLALARARIGGQTGDILGASQQLADLAALAMLAATI
jgi:adenosylcobinamide-GDP ribazoletransferase